METQFALASILKNQTSDPFSTLFTPKETSEYLGVTEPTLAVWRCTGRYDIPYLKVGRLVKYRKADLDAWLVCRTKGGV